MRSRDSDWRAWLHLRSVFMRRCGKSTINEMTLTRHSMLHLLNIVDLDVMGHYDDLIECRLELTISDYASGVLMLVNSRRILVATKSL
jgi:hypothetical protein